MNKTAQNRLNNILPNGKPKYVRCYDNNGETADRYTVVFTGHYTHKTNTQIDYPSYGHLGKKITFDQLPTDCQKCVMQTYVDLWDIQDAIIENDDDKRVRQEIAETF